VSRVAESTLAEHYAARGVELLSRAEAAGPFKRLLAEVEKKAAAGKKGAHESACGAVTVCVRSGQGARPSSTSNAYRKCGTTSRLVE
jgi:hypothetical protein